MYNQQLVIIDVGGHYQSLQFFKFNNLNLLVMSNQLSPIEVARSVPMVQYSDDCYNEVLQSRITDIRKLSCGTGTKNGTMASGASDTEEVDSD